MLTQAELKELLHYDPSTGVFTWLESRQGVKASLVAGTLNSKGYHCIKIKGRLYRAHRLAWLYVQGVWPKDQIDHRNHVRNDNRINNLREATNMQNCTNRCDNTSGTPGVSWDTYCGRWTAQIQVAGRGKNLGRFASLEDAAEARRAAELKYFGVNAL